MSSRDESFAPTVDLRSSMQRRPGRPGKIEAARDPRRALSRLVPYLGPYRAALALVLLFIAAASVIGLAGPYLMGVAIDGIAGGRGAAALAGIAALMLASYAIGNLLTAAANRIMARVSQLALKDLRGELFGRLQSLPIAFFDSNPAGSLMSRLTSDIDAINQAVSQNVTALAASALSMVGILAAMFALNHWLALASLVVVPIMLGFARFVAAYTRKGFRKLQRDLGELNAVAEETLSGQRVVKAFGRGEAAIEAFRSRNRAVFESGVYANSYAMLLMPLTQVLGGFFVVALASLGGALALAGLASVGTIAAFINYGQNFTQPLRQIANLYNSIQAALAGAERVFEVIDAPPEEPNADSERAAAPSDGESPARAAAPAIRGRRGPAIRGDLSIRDLGFSYVPGLPVIEDFCLEAEAGQTIALVGPTGAGKTTIINLLARFYDIEKGSILIDGVDIRAMRRAELRRSLGVVPQDTFLFADTVLENIRFGRLDASDEDCVEAARLAEADHFIRQLPRGYATSLSERASNLSQGQRQLIAISRAILSDPAILILDEATSSVDTRTESRIQQALLRLMEGRTSLVIAHRLSTIRDADKVAVIDKGRIVEEGSHDGLMAAHGFYYRLFMSQFKAK